MSKTVFGFVVCLGMSWAVWAAADAGAPAAWKLHSLRAHSEARVRITGGWFEMGSDTAELDKARALCTQTAAGPCDTSLFAAERAAHRVYVRAFAIDQREVSNADHQRCVDAGRCHPPRSPKGEPEPRPALPVVHLTFAEARDYCRFAGGDLPSEAQWEYAARGSSARSFPWGQAWNPHLAQFASSEARLQAVDAFGDGKSFFGLLNMAGNVWELVLDGYRATYDPDLPNVDPLAPAGSEPSSEHVLRGGSFRSPPYMLRARYRAAIRSDEARPDVGLRCAYPAGTAARSMLGSTVGRTYAARAQ